MAYIHTQYEVVPLATDGTREFSATSTGAKASWAPGMKTHTVRGVAITNMATQSVATALVFSVRKNGDVGSASATGDQQDTITIATSASQGDVYYIENLDIEVDPGADLEINCTTAATQASVTCQASLLVEPKWDVPGNNSDMTESA